MADLPPGVPALLNTAADFASSAVALVSDAIGIFGGLTGPQWGIFEGGSAVIAAETIASVEFRKDWVVGDYPIEGGSFQSYDKVEEPFDGRARFVAGGSISNREGLLSSIASIAGDTTLRDFVTPEATYSSATIRHYDYRRAADRGLGLMIVDVWIQEVRQGSLTSADSSSFSSNNTSAPDGADAQNGGSVQAAPATSPQTQAASSGAGSVGDANLSFSYAPGSP